MWVYTFVMDGQCTPILTHFPDSESTSLSSFSLIPCSWWRSNKYQFYSLCLTRMGTDPRSTALDASTLTIKPPMWLGAKEIELTVRIIHTLKPNFLRASCMTSSVVVSLVTSMFLYPDVPLKKQINHHIITLNVQNCIRCSSEKAKMSAYKSYNYN